MTVFLTSIQSIIPIIVIIALGYILQLKGWFSESFVLKYLTVDKLISLSGGLLYTFGAFALTYIFGFLAVKLCGVRAGRRGTMINTFVNANTIFIGLPLNVALFGEEALPYFLIYYITNTISTWTLGVYIMTSDSVGGKKKEGTKFDWKKLLPAPLVGFLIALVFLLLGISVPAFAENTLTYIGNIVTPLSLIYIGIILAKAGLKSIHLDKDTAVTVVGRFILAPAIMYALLFFAGRGLPTKEFNTFVIQSATPALAVLPILASQGDGDVEFSTNVVTISTVLFILVVPFLMTLLG